MFCLEIVCSSTFLFQYDCESSPTLYDTAAGRQMKDIDLDLLAPHHDFPLDTELSMELTESLITTARPASLHHQSGPLFPNVYSLQVDHQPPTSPI